jgi:hypothetical protein
MRTTKAVMFAVTAMFLAAGFTQAGAESGQSSAQAARTSVRTQAAPTASSAMAQAAAPIAQADGIFYAGKVAKPCTYRGGPKTGNWDCR